MVACIAAAVENERVEACVPSLQLSQKIVRVERISGQVLIALWYLASEQPVGVRPLAPLHDGRLHAVARKVEEGYVARLHRADKRASGLVECVDVAIFNELARKPHALERRVHS